MPRRRSLSASRTVSNTVNFVGRIGASLRISSKNAIKRFDSTETPPPPPSASSSWRARLDRSKSAVSPRSFPSHSSFDSDSILLASGTAIEAGIGCGSDDDRCTAGELIEYATALPNAHALVSATSASQRSLYGTPYHRSAPSSCPATPQMIRRRYMKEGATQLTSLSTLVTHHRYLFLFNDLLLISKQKGGNSYKLKQKINLDYLWLSSNNCNHSFLIGWPLCNYVAHFNTEEEKNEWYEKLSSCIRRRFKAKSTTVSVAVKVEGREQIIKKEVHNGQSASELVAELIRELDLGPCENSLELLFDTGNAATVAAVVSAAANPNQHLLHGIENVYAILMDHISQSSVQLSETQMAHLDTCPLVHCRLILRSVTSSRPNTAMNLMNQVLKVLSRSENKRLFGKDLEGSMPPQPVLTMIDHLMIHGFDMEGILRKSPKQATVRLLKSQLDNGQVPDFHQYNVHVTASLLKEYLRSIPGQLLLSGNYHLWMEVCEETDVAKKKQLCRSLLKLLPQCHTVLLRSVLRLLRKVSANEQASKMSVSSLGVCIAPSLLENPNVLDSAKRVPDLAIFLIQNATELFDGFEDDGLLSPEQSHRHTTASFAQPLRLHQSTDSGLSTDDPVDSMARSSISPDSALFDSPISEGSMDDEHQLLLHQKGPRIEEIESIPSPPPSKERTPVLSRENSDMYNVPHRMQWRSHLSADAGGPRLMRQEAFRQVVSTQSSISSQDNEDTPTPLEEEVRVLRLPPGPLDPITNVDDLRVSDIIISHRKKDSSDSTKTLRETTHHTTYSSKSSEYSGKFSPLTSSSLEGRSTTGSLYCSSLSSSSSGSGYRSPLASRPPLASPVRTTTPVVLMSPKASSAKRPLLSKSETLGVACSPPSSSTTLTSTVLTPLHRTRRLPPSSTNSLDRSTPPKVGQHRTPLMREPTIHPQNSLDRAKNNLPYRPPKRTAEEIVLDSTLEVNWSVPSIRSVFQQHKDAKPTHIDTVYATLDSFKKQPLEQGSKR